MAGQRKTGRNREKDPLDTRCCGILPTIAEGEKEREKKGMFTRFCCEKGGKREMMSGKAPDWRRCVKDAGGEKGGKMKSDHRTEFLPRRRKM